MRIFALFCIIGFCQPAGAQTQKDTINRIDTLVWKAQELDTAGNHAAALTMFNQALELTSAAGLNKSVEGYINIRIGFSWLNRRDARKGMQYLQKARAQYEAGENTADPDYCDLLSQIGIIGHFDLKQSVDSMYRYSELALACAIEALEPDDPVLAKYYYMAGSCSVEKMDKTSAQIQFAQAYRLLYPHSLQYPDEFLSISEYLVSIYTDLQLYDSALIVATERLKTGRQFFSPTDTNLAKVYYVLAHTMNVSNLIDSSLVYLDSAIRIHPRVCPPATRAEFFYRGGIYFFQRSELARAKYYFLQSGSELAENKIDNSLEGSAWLYVAGIYAVEMKVAESLQYQDKACALFRRHFGEKDYRTIQVCGMAKAMKTLGNGEMPDLSLFFPDAKPGEYQKVFDTFLGSKMQINLKDPFLNDLMNTARETEHFPVILRAVEAMYKGNYPEVITLVQRFYTLIVPGFTDSLNLRSDPDINAPMLQSNILMTAMLLKSAAFDQLGRKSNNAEALKYACLLLEKCDTIINNSRMNTVREDMVSWGAMISNVYREMMYTASTAAKISGDKVYFDKTFYASEKLKAYSLLKTADPEKARVLAPPALLEREKVLERQSMRLRRDLKSAYQQSDKPDKIDINSKLGKKIGSLKDSLFQTEATLAEARLELRVRHPRYWETVNEKPIVSIHELSGALDGRTALLSYTCVSDSEVYLLVITRDKNGFHIGKTIPGLKKMVESVAGFTSGANTDTAAYARSAQTLYRALICDIPPGTEQLIVIPDGYLHQLPFEALLTENLDDPHKKPFKDFPFLIMQYAMSYGYSATLTYHLLKDRHQRDYPNFLLGYGSSKYKNFGHIRPLCDANKLKYTIRENRETATKADLLRQDLTSYRLVHIAAHGDESKEPDLFGIMFPDKEIMYYSDFYQLEIEADLFLLLACLSGKGSFVDSEGVIGLNRALHKAGAKNVLLYKEKMVAEVNAEFCRYFYRNLIDKPADSYGKSLQIARKQMITEENGRYANPVFWSGYYLIGF